MSRIVALIVRTGGKLTCEGLAEGGEIPALVDRYKELCLSGKIIKGAGKAGIHIDEARLLANNTANGELKKGYKRRDTVSGQV